MVVRFSYIQPDEQMFANLPLTYSTEQKGNIYSIAHILFCLNSKAMVKWFDNENVGADVAATEDVELQPFEYNLVPIGVKTAFPTGFQVEIRPRSSTYRNFGCIIPNSPCTVDPGYRGELKVPFVAVRDKVTITRGMRVAQMVISLCLHVQRDRLLVYPDEVRIVYTISDELFNRWDELFPSDRGDKGFGSTGVT